MGVSATIFFNTLYCVLLSHIVEPRVSIQIFGIGTFRRGALEFKERLCRAEFLVGGDGFSLAFQRCGFAVLSRR